MKKGWLALALAVTLLVPVSAKASPIDSFASGFDDLVNPKVQKAEETETGNEEPGEQEDRNEPMDVPMLAAPAAEPTVLDRIISTVRAWTRVSYATNSGPVNQLTLQQVVMFFLTGSSIGNTQIWSPVMVGVGLVFLWWGVRKSKQIIWTAFRTGRLNLGTSVKRAWYRHKDKEWYG